MNSILLPVFFCHLLFSLNIMFVRLIHIDTFCFALFTSTNPLYVNTTNYLSLIMSGPWIVCIFCYYKQCCYEHSYTYLQNMRFSKLHMHSHIHPGMDCWAMRYFYLYKIRVNYFPKWLYQVRTTTVLGVPIALYPH